VPGKPKEERANKPKTHVGREIFAQPQVFADLAAVAALVDAAHQHEEGARGDAVVEHDHERALQSAQGEEEDAQGHEPHVGHDE